MKKIRVLTMLASSMFILSAVGCSSATTNTAATNNAPVTMIASEDFPSYTSIGDLSERANTIVKGNVIQTRVEALNDRVQATDENGSALNEQPNPGGEDVPFDKIYTIHTIQITESYKGDFAAGDTIEVKQLGGQLGNTEIINDDNIMLTPTKDYVLFLETYKDTPASLLNSVQSLYVVKPAAKSSQPGVQQAKSEVVVSVNPENDLTLSINELQEIQSEEQNK